MRDDVVQALDGGGADDGLLDAGDLRFRPMNLPDAYFEAGPQYEQYENAGLNAKHIKGTVMKLMGKTAVPQLA